MDYQTRWTSLQSDKNLRGPRTYVTVQPMTRASAASDWTAANVDRQPDRQTLVAIDRLLAPEQQTRRTLLLLSIDGTDRDRHSTVLISLPHTMRRMRTAPNKPRSNPRVTWYVLGAVHADTAEHRAGRA